jgi:Etoposide-induced protein 2.4 (EI24)
MLNPMPLIVDALWRSLVDCLRPRVVGLSLLPLGVMAGLAYVLGVVYWTEWVSTVSEWLEARTWLTGLLGWIQTFSHGTVDPDTLRNVLAPLLVLGVTIPAVVVVSLLLVSLAMTPYLVRMVAARRFPHLLRKQGASLWGSVWWSAVSASMAMLAMLASLPLWLIPPLMLVLPPLIWGWLSYRVFAFDALADHASAAERHTILAEHRVPLVCMGVMSGFVGTAPGVLWASSSFFVLLAPILIPLAIWMYALVFAFSSLWFTHYALACLERLRRASGPAVSPLPGGPSRPNHPRSLPSQFPPDSAP